MSEPVSILKRKDLRKRIYSVHHSADTTRRYKKLESDFDKSQIINECETIIDGFIESGGSIPPSAPWWFRAAMNYLEVLYKAPKIERKAFEIAASIKSFMRGRGREKRRLSRKEMMSIVTAMFVIHNHKLIPFNGKKETYYDALKTIKGRVYRSK